MSGQMKRPGSFDAQKIGASSAGAGRTKGPPETAGAQVQSVVVGTAGHIDHGKTALVWALTGTDTDRLPEEKARGITIDLGFAALELREAGGARLDVSLVDVPGHHAFVRNMLAGAAGVDAVMLVVAADEGVKAQTVEHLQICRLLSIERGMVVLTKQDAAGPERLAEVRADVARLVKGTFLDGAPVVSVSALRGEGMEELRTVLSRVAEGVPRRGVERLTRLPVDRAFSVRGFGTVVTGTLQGGSVSVGESLRLQPEGRPVRVRGIQIHGTARSEATAPNRVALNLAGVEVGEVARGDVLAPAGSLQPVTSVDVELEPSADARALRHRQRVRVHAFAAESSATLLLFQGPDLAGGSAAAGSLARLRLAKPMILLPGDRFVLRRPSPAVTLGGGRVIDAHPRPRLRKALALPWLREMQRAGQGEQLLLRVKRRGMEGIERDVLVLETGLRPAGALRLLEPLLTQGRVVASGGHLIEADALDEAEKLLLHEVGRAAQKGLPRAELRWRLRLGPWVFDLAIKRLEASRQLSLVAEEVFLPGREGQRGNDPALDARAAQVDELYRSAGLASPLVSEAAARLGMAQEELRGVLTALLRTSRLVRLGSDALLVHSEALAKLKEELKQRRGESLDVGRFKELTGLTRKHAIPLLEHLDGARVTRNAGGVRVVL